MPRGIKNKIEEVREATDDREDYYAVADGNKIAPTKLGWVVGGIVAILAVVGLLVILL